MKINPHGVQSFTEIIEGGYIYVDKTRFIHELVKPGAGKAIFLARPRRFGKSLLLDTVATLFGGAPESPDYRDGLETTGTGNRKGDAVIKARAAAGIDEEPWKRLEPAEVKSLFSGTWIGSPEAGYDFTQGHPVILLDMQVKRSSPEAVEEALKRLLIDRAASEGREFHSGFTAVPEATPGELLKRLIMMLKARYKSKVVLLFDEYDCPVSDNLDDHRLAEANREVLKEFYGALKGSGHRIRLAFATGVTRYAMAGLSAGLNQLRDITLNEGFAGACGFTEKELDDNFSERLEHTRLELIRKGHMPGNLTPEGLRALIRLWYDGYSWDGHTRVLNPWDILNLLADSEFSSYWMSTLPSDRPVSMLASLDNPLAAPRLSVANVPKRIIGRSELNTVDLEAALFQTGYLTVESVERSFNDDALYTLRIPNWEVRNAELNLFSRRLINSMNRDLDADRIALEESVAALDAGRLAKLFASLFTSLFTSLPSKHHRDTESCYHVTLYSCLTGLGFQTAFEPQEGLGIQDLAISLDGGRLCAAIELKYAPCEEKHWKDANVKDELAAGAAANAIDAANAKDYGSPFRRKAERLVRVGLGVTYRGWCRVLVSETR